MRVLALDLATSLGFAVGDADGVQCHGSHRLPSTRDDIGSFLAAYRSWLVPMISKWQPREIVFEMPILPATTNPATVRKLMSLCGLTELLAQDAGIGCREANLWDIRKHFIGTRFAPKDIPRNQKRAWLKDKTMLVCLTKGFHPADDNAADALAILSYVLVCQDPNFHMQASEIAGAA